MLNLSQDHVALATGMSRKHYGLIERGRATNLTLAEMNAIASVLGLTTSVRLFPGGTPIRDRAHTTKLIEVLGWVMSPLRYRIEVPLPVADGRWEQRAWDADGLRRWCSHGDRARNAAARCPGGRSAHQPEATRRSDRTVPAPRSPTRGRIGLSLTRWRSVRRSAQTSSTGRSFSVRGWLTPSERDPADLIPLIAARHAISTAASGFRRWCRRCR